LGPFAGGQLVAQILAGVEDFCGLKCFGHDVLLSVVVLDADDDDGPAVYLFDFDDETKLLVESHRPLVAASAFEFFVVQALRRIERPLVWRGTDKAHQLAIGTNNVCAESSAVVQIGFHPLQFLIGVPDIHVDNITL
jgi:hypothetical protein